MDVPEIIKVSLQAIANNKIRAFLTMLGIIIGVASVIMLVSIGNGLQGYINNQLNTLGSTLIDIQPGKVEFSASGGPPSLSASKLDDEVLEIIVKQPSVEAVEGWYGSPGVAKYKNKQVYITQIVGVGAQFLEIVGYKVALGRYYSENAVRNGDAVVVLGDKVVQDLFGDNTTPLDKLITMDGKVYTVIGVLEKIGGGGFGGVADNIALIPTTTYKKYFNPNNYVEIYARAKEEAGADRAAAEIKRALSRKLDPDSDFTVFTQAQLLESLNSILGAVTGALGGIAAISLLVGGICIMNIMLVSVTERTREIGLRKAVGAKPTAILLQFILEAIILSLFGGLVGILVGAGGAWIINQFITTQVTLPAVGLAFGVSVLIGVVFGTAPAISAARKDPIIALRYE